VQQIILGASANAVEKLLNLSAPRRRNRRTRYATGREGKGGSHREGQAIVQSRALKTITLLYLSPTLLARADEVIE
jgi:hypothetical protein